jgi:signal transduction histidine kinase/CheY-like chemotaxis protein
MIKTKETSNPEQAKAELSLRETNELLKLFAVQSSRQEYTDSVTRLLQEWTGCEAVGIRLRDDEDKIPYGSHVGFDEQFWESENELDLDRDDCICTRVTKGKVSSSDNPFMTTRGSFTCTAAAEAFSVLGPEERKWFRGRCIEAGYETLAVIPILYRDKRLGVIHLADHRKEKINSGRVAFLESVSPLIGEAVHRFHLEEEQEKLQQQLLQIQKIEALGTATGGIAHDFNNILAAMIGFTEIVKGRVNAGTKEDHLLGRVLEAGLKGRSLIKQMMTFARKTKTEKKPVRLSEIISETFTLLRASIPETVDVEISVKSESSPIIGDPDQLRQVLVNLCNNSVYAMRDGGGRIDLELSDFSAPSGKTSVTAMRPGSYVRLSVRDTGEGIPPENVSRVFDPFFSTKNVGQGTGLGLSVVHGIVSQHDGYIAVQSIPHENTLFEIYFPTASEQSKKTTLSEGDSLSGSEKILLVDDEEMLIEMGKELLEELGYQVTTARGGREALALFASNPSEFDLVITDHTMPDMTGVQLAKEFLAFRKDIPIVLLTGYSNVVDGQSARALGISAFVMKPLTKREIAETVRTTLGNRLIDG